MRSKSFFLGLALLLATSAFAANKGSLQLQEPVNVNGTRLAAGDYKVEWSGSGPNVRLDLVQDGATVATVPAKVVTENSAHDQDGYVLQTANGGKTIAEIFFSGTKYDLEIQPSRKSS